ncbi:MAG: hypothetical protein JNM94_08845 [Phycisphaerae bacterium]|nr:hypothetical protein [Phycisphaerae bacterium]
MNGRLAAICLTTGLIATGASADGVYQTLPFTQNWTNTGLITANDNWSGVPGIIGFLGQDITTTTGINPQTLLTVSTVANDVDVIANQTNTTISNGGVAEFEITDPAVALQGSGTADAPYIQLHLDTSGQSNITLAYNVRDLDGSADNAIQQLALQYRIGDTGSFTDIPAGYIADATTGPSLATLVTNISLTLPAACENQPNLQVRIITTNAVGSDEWVGIDDISVTAGGGVSYSCAIDGPDAPAETSTIATFDYTLTQNPGGTPVAGEDVTFTVVSGPSAGFTQSLQTNANGFVSFSFTSNAPGVDQVEISADTTPNPTICLSSVTWFAPTTDVPIVINELDSDTPGADTLEFIELYDGGAGRTPLDGLVVVFYNGSNDLSYAAFDLDGKQTNGEGYFVLGNATLLSSLPGSFGPENVLSFADNGLQNGQDAVALYAGDATSFPTNTPVTVVGVRDALVYDTSDADDAGLLVLLNAGQPQVDENGGGNGATHSVQRIPNGSGGLRNTVTFAATTSTPGASNAYTNSPSNVAATPNPVCLGESTSLSASIGADESLDWYEGSVNGTFLGSGNPFSVTPSAATTYVAVVRANSSGAIGGNASVNVEVSAPQTWYADTDGDGAGDPATSVVACVAPVGFVGNSDDGCPADSNKVAPGQCGCGVVDEDTDGDGTANCVDGCPDDPAKTAPGQCGCGTPDSDTDGDGTADCADGCPNDPLKTAPGACGCGVADTDSDGDGTADCNDGCPSDPNKIDPGACGCGVPDVDADGDGTFDCNDGCPNDPAKSDPGVCGCGTPDSDADNDGVADCIDQCPGYPDGDDCNANGFPDACDVTSGGSEDVNNNLVPDECECIGDLDDNGVVDGADLALVLGNWGNPGIGDVNNDGTTDGADLGLVLGAWGSCG